MRFAPDLLAAPLLAVALALPAGAGACGYHDPSSINLGALNMAYPDSLHVRTAVWMAQRDGALPPRETAPDGEDGQAARVRAVMRMGMTVAKLRALRDRLEAEPAQERAPAFSVVLIGPMLWARFDRAGGKLSLEAHADGPGRGDVIVVTDEPVVTALVEGLITPQAARRLGLVRLYGDRPNVEEVESLLDRRAQSTAVPLSQSIRTPEAN